MPDSVAYEDGDEHEPTHTDVDLLQHHGVGQADIMKLKSSGYCTIGLVMAAMKKNLLKIKGFSETKVDKIKEASRNATGRESGWVTGAEILDLRKKCFRISTGSKQWDTILNGGFESGSMNEVFGEYRCGKTQLAHTMAVMAQLPKCQGGGNGKVAWLDTEGTYRPERIQQIAERFSVDPRAANENISIIRVQNSENQDEALGDLAQHLAGGEYRLLVVDSIIACFRNDYAGRGELSERQHKLLEHLNRLKRMAEEFNMVVFVTNQVQSDPGASALFAGADGRKSVGGHILAHTVQTRILLRKGRGDERVAKVIDSPDCPEGEATYIITNGGIKDPDKA